MALKSVYKPDTELLAMSLKSLLEQSGIQAMLHSFQIPWYDGLAKMMRPEWGEILVDEDDYEQAKEIIDNFLASQSDTGHI
ncbi:MAG: DUF2007 domain-containing protein [Candidatus Latescibacteria bacterium]|nr:DUF2007 domain-containing protein [Candidatus Latescibacterota bacterium]